MRDDAVTADVAVLSDQTELVDAAMCADDGMVLDRDVPAEGRSMRQNAVRTDMAVVRHMRISLKQIVVTDGSQKPAALRPR